MARASASSCKTLITTIVCAVTTAVLAQAGEEWPESDQLPEEHENNVQTGALALALGSPAGINLSLATLESDHAGIELSGAYVPGQSGRIYGFEVGPLILLSQSSRHFSGLFISVGYSRIDQKDYWAEDFSWSYGAVGLIYKWRTLYTQVGLSVGSGSYANPQLIGQIGITLVTFKKR